MVLQTLPLTLREHFGNLPWCSLTHVMFNLQYDEKTTLETASSSHPHVTCFFKRSGPPTDRCAIQPSIKA